MKRAVVDNTLLWLQNEKQEQQDVRTGKEETLRGDGPDQINQVPQHRRIDEPGIHEVLSINMKGLAKTD